ncbi:MAG: response regulator [Bdellovibrionales bacterium]|nr:response regulator [Bdellovibrionales bacterium]
MENAIKGTLISVKHILVVEDDCEMRELICEFLEARGFRLSTFRSALCALEAIYMTKKGDGDHFDLVISDINMPQMDGFEFLKLSKSVIPSLPVILITSFGNQVTERAALNEGAAAYLNKPFSLSKLQTLIHCHL